MAAADEFRGHQVSVATDSLGGASIGRVQSYEWLITLNATPSYALGSSSPYVVGTGNKQFNGTMTMAFRDVNEVLTLLSPTLQVADSHFVRYSTGVSATETADITITGLKYGSGGVTASNDGGIVVSTYPFEATAILIGETTN